MQVMYHCTQQWDTYGLKLQLVLHACVVCCLICAGGTASPGCGGVLQLPALRLADGLHHHTLSHRQRQGVLRVLLEGEHTRINIFFNFSAG